MFLVKSRRPGWDQIYLPLRPNGRTGWVKGSRLTLALDPYRSRSDFNFIRVVDLRGDVPPGMRGIVRGQIRLEIVCARRANPPAPAAEIHETGVPQ